jgi:hypothetical protein
MENLLARLVNRLAEVVRWLLVEDRFEAIVLSFLRRELFRIRIDLAVVS